MSNTSALNVFIIGASTAAGREAVRQFSARGHKVTGVTDGSPGGALVRLDGGLPAFSNPNRVGELKSMLHMGPYDVLVHLGTQAANSFPSRKTDWSATNEAITTGTATALEAAASSGVKFVVYASYAFLYGDMHGETVTEASEAHDLNPAFKAALRAEKAVIGHSVPGCVLRAGIVYSSEDAGAAALSEDVLRGRSIYTGDSHNVLNWVHAADLASAVVLAAEQQPAGELFNIVDDHPVSAAAFADAMGTGLGLGAVNRQSIPGFALPMMTTEMQRAILESSARASNAKAKQALGWKLKYPSYQSGMEQTLLGWRAGQAVKG